LNNPNVLNIVHSFGTRLDAQSGRLGYVYIFPGDVEIYLDVLWKSSCLKFWIELATVTVEVWRPWRVCEALN
jgi:hypothetical protein